MNPFELTKDPDGGGMTIRVKHGFVVLTREEEMRVTERLAGLMDENAKLREQIVQLQADWESERDYADQMEAKEKRAVAENAKLREYAESYAKAVECEGCGWCPYDMDAVCDTETMPMRDGCKLYDELRELRIEVNE